MRAIIFANGEFPNPQEAKKLCDERGDDAILIAADGGTRHALSIGVIPHVVIGDLDSLSPADRARLEEANARLIPFSPRKDKTDLELALLHAASDGATAIVVLGALGGRLDQTLANVLLLSLPELEHIDTRIVEGTQEAFLVRRETRITGHPGDTVSLIPLGGDAEGVTSEGLEWELHDDILRSGPARGVSNVLLGEQGRVCVRRGVLLCVVNRAVGSSR